VIGVTLTTQKSLFVVPLGLEKKYDMNVSTWDKSNVEVVVQTGNFQSISSHNIRFVF